MAPLSAEPRHLLVVLNPTKRRALYTLLYDITAYIRSQLELKDGPSGPKSHAASTSTQGRTASSSSADTATGNAQRPTAPLTPEIVALRDAALQNFDAWRRELLEKVKELVTAPDDGKILEARRQRLERLAALQKEVPEEGENLISFDGVPQTDIVDGKAKDLAALQELFHPIPSKFPTLPVADRKEVISSVLLLLLSLGNYSAHSRALAVYLTSAFELPLEVLITEETEIAKSLVESSSQAQKQGTMSAEAEAEKRRQENQASRYWKVGLASVAGAAVIGITGGLAAPVVAGAIGGLMGTVGLGGVASFLGIFWMNGALVGTLFGAFGAKMTGEMVDTYAKEVEDFCFLPLKEEWGRDCAKQSAEDQSSRRLRVTIGINGWLTTNEDVTKPWRVLGDDSEVFALRYEMESLLGLGNALEGLVTSYAWNFAKLEILKRTVLASLWTALWPAYLISMASALDNPFSLARHRSQKAGRVLADALINRVQGERPVTLIGYSLGARVIYSCLRSLAKRKAFGLVDTVVLIGAPVPSNKAHWQMLRSVVSGKIFNVYSENDYILAFLYRATSLQLGIAGLQPIKDIDGVENLDLTEEVAGHLRYPGLIAKILTRCGFPGVRGGEGPIERDEDIKLHDEEAPAEMGTLIELHELPAEERHRNESKRPQMRKTYSEELRMSMEPTAAGPSAGGKSKASVTRSGATAVTDFTDPLAPGHEDDLPAPPKSLGVSANEKFLPAETKPWHPSSWPKSVASSSPPPKSSRSNSSATAVGSVAPSVVATTMVDDSSDPDDDEENWVGIRMVDNDDDGAMMTSYMEPLRLED